MKKRYLAIIGLAMAGIFSASGPAQAQNGTSPLAGKTVHLYNPFGEAPSVIFLGGGDFALTSESGNWLKFDFSSVGTSLQPWVQQFHFHTKDYQQQFGPAGLTGGAEFEATVFPAGAKEIWIMVDPQGEPKAVPTVLTAPPRQVHVFNPWPISGPEIVLNGVRKGMLVDAEHCGWYLEYILATGPLKAHFANVADGEPWGKGGLQDPADFDLTAEFQAKGSSLWISDLGAITAAYPGKEGTCTYLMAATVHDLAMTHPDYSPSGAGVITGMVQSQLGPDRKPVAAGAAPAHFSTWFNSDSTKAMPLKGYESCVDLTMGKSDDGQWEYDSYHTPAKGYFPIDQANRLDANAGPSCYNDPVTGASISTNESHNFGFCMESHASFIYQKGQVFQFRGDDDVWVFIDNKLALDLGGAHVATPGSIAMDSQGLIAGKQYNWDFFFCERKECASSLRIKTTIYFKQQRGLDHEEVSPSAGGVQYRIIKREGGTGACGSLTGTLKEVEPGPLLFTLFDPAGNKVQDLPPGISFGGITLEAPKVVVDTSMVTGLAPGIYRIVYKEIAHPEIQDEVRFTLASKNKVEFDPPFSQDTSVGGLVRLTVANRQQGALVPMAETYALILPAGLEVYADKAKTTRITAGTLLKTDATGLDSLWVTADSADLMNLAGKTYILGITGSTRKDTLTFRMPPLDLPKAVSASLFDDDADGIADRFVAVYDRDITGIPPKQIGMRWPSSAVAIESAQSDLPNKIEGGKNLVLTGRYSQTPLTGGEGIYSSTYPARGKDSVQSLPILDRVGPIILKAEISLGKTTDTLRMVFSEPIATASITAGPQDLFRYKAMPADAPIAYPPQTLAWNADGTEATLLFSNASAAFPHAGYLVRAEDGPGRIADASGNATGTASRFRLITGPQRAAIHTVTYRSFAPDQTLLDAPAILPSLQPLDSKVAEVVERTGRMGHLIATDLGGFAVKDDFSNVDPSQVTLEYAVAYFTNLGVPVREDKRMLSCRDAVYSGDCLTHRGFVFVGWNYTAADGAKVATGAYVARIRFWIRVSGKVVESDGLDQVWGILRKD